MVRLFIVLSQIRCSKKERKKRKEKEQKRRKKRSSRRRRRCRQIERFVLAVWEAKPDRIDGKGTEEGRHGQSRD